MRKKLAVRIILTAVVWTLLAGGVAASYRFLASADFKARVEGVRDLAESDWMKLTPSADVAVPQITFARGSVDFDEDARRELLELAGEFKSRPHLYVRVTGQSRASGDREANRRLAMQRAASIAEFLIAHGIGSGRVHATTTEPDSNEGSQSVSFVIGKRPE